MVSMKPKTRSDYDSLKAEYETLVGDSITHDDFISVLLLAFRRDRGEPFDTEAMIMRLREAVGNEVELAAYRGCEEYHERHE